MVVTDTAGPPAALNRANHICWAYQDATEFWGRAVAFLTAGVVAGDRLEYLGSGSVPDLHGRLRAVPGFDVLLDTGRLRVRSLGEHYGVQELDPTAPVAARVRRPSGGSRHARRTSSSPARSTSRRRTCSTAPSREPCR